MPSRRNWQQCCDKAQFAIRNSYSGYWKFNKTFGIYLISRTPNYREKYFVSCCFEFKVILRSELMSLNKRVLNTFFFNFIVVCKDKKSSRAKDYLAEVFNSVLLSAFQLISVLLRQVASQYLNTNLICILPFARASVHTHRHSRKHG